VRRAIHQQIDRPLVFEDPLAIKMVDPAHLTDEMAAARLLRAFLVVRSRFAEDTLADAVSAGVHQYVLLGAGLDTFAYRNPYGDMRVFEVDHPATQAWKRSILETAGIAASRLLTFVAIDFERETLAEGLAQAGFDAEQPAFFAWLGVVPYLTAYAVAHTLHFIGSRKPRSGVAFDYATDPALLPPAQREAAHTLAARVARAGEPFRSFFDPNALAGVMRRSGFSIVDDWDAHRINTRYFSGRSDGLRVAGAGRLMRAVV